MNQTNPIPHYIAALQSQPPNLSRLSFCANNKPTKVKNWVNELRATQTSETSATLYRSLPEIARLKATAEIRLEILEIVRPAAQHAIEGLTREFLNRPINLSREAQKTAIIAQAIQKTMIDGYVQCVVDICKMKRFKQLTMDTLTKALHRAITGIGLVFFRSYQLYTQPPTGFWQQLHTLFQIADYFDLLAKPVIDELLEHARATNLQTAYMRVLLMATAKLNQLSQKDIAQIYSALETWSQYARLHLASEQDKDIFYLVNISSDLPPSYKSRFEGNATDRILQLSFKVLVSLLAKQSPSQNEEDGSISQGSLAIPIGFPASLVDHLLNCWSSIAQRKQDRRHVHTTADVCVGLVNAHYYVSGKQRFEEFTAKDDALGKEFDASVVESLNSSFAPEEHTADVTASEPPTYNVEIQNVSAGGCCLLWKKAVPPRLQSGELIGLKEEGRHSWSIGVVRWIRQFRGGSQLGIQILANHPKPFAAGQMYDMGGYSDYMRAIYIPASKNGQSPASILTAQAPFKEMDKVKVFDGEQNFKAKLSKTLFNTGAVRQFAYNPIDLGKTRQTPHKRTPDSNTAPPDSFDESWD